jgi:hypothetical protein
MLASGPNIVQMNRIRHRYTEEEAIGEDYYAQRAGRVSEDEQEDSER